jgi:hypothetical protein
MDISVSSRLQKVEECDRRPKLAAHIRNRWLLYVFCFVFGFGV